MNILEILQQLTKDIKLWVTNNIQALNEKIDTLTMPIDDELNLNSSNPVQNKIIAEEIEKINANISNSNQNFSGEYSDIKNAPAIEDDASGDFIITDQEGNIITLIDNSGINTTAIITKDIVLNNLNIAEELKNLNNDNQNLESQLKTFENSLLVETWDFILDDGTSVSKKVVIKS